MIAIDLFAGAGGMSVGAEQTGIHVALAVELDPHAAQTYRTNFPLTTVCEADIRTLIDIDIDTRGEETIIFGGPPCQGFSTSNQRTRTRDNDGNWLFREFIRIVALWMPDWVVFENVRGIVETEGGIFLAHVVAELEALGYTCTQNLLNAVDFGVPQRRSRLFVVGSLHGTRVEVTLPRRQPIVTVEQAIGDLPILDAGATINELPYGTNNPSTYARRLRRRRTRSTGHLVTRNAPHVIARYEHIEPGGNWEQIPPYLMANYTDFTRCHTGIYRRLRNDEPSVVIGNYRKNMLIHPTQQRGLSVREAARIQSFPDRHRFNGSIGFQQQQVGNAVPPALAYAVFQAINEP